MYESAETYFGDISRPLLVHPILHPDLATTVEMALRSGFHRIPLTISEHEDDQGTRWLTSCMFDEFGDVRILLDDDDDVSSLMVPYSLVVPHVTRKNEVITSINRPILGWQSEVEFGAYDSGLRHHWWKTRNEKCNQTVNLACRRLVSHPDIHDAVRDVKAFKSL